MVLTQILDLGEEQDSERIFQETTESIIKCPVLWFPKPNTGENIITHINPTTHIKKVCENGCSVVYKWQYGFIKAVAEEIYTKYPGSMDRQTWAGDACLMQGLCPNHGTSHGTKSALDLNYFTLAESNCTQYGRVSRVKIWDDSVKFLNDDFDIERNSYFYWRLAVLTQNNTDRVCYMNETIRVAIINHLEDNFPAGSSQEFISFCPSGDSGTNFNHHIHAHVEIGDWREF